MMMMMMMMMMIIIIIIRRRNHLIHTAQFDTNGTLTALYMVIQYIYMQYRHIMDIHETIIFIHIYMSTHTYIHRHM